MTSFALNFPLKVGICLQISYYPISSKTLACCPEFDVGTLEMPRNRKKDASNLTSAEDQPEVK